MRLGDNGGMEERYVGKFSEKINLCHVAPPEALHALVPHTRTHALMAQQKRRVIRCHDNIK